jgi:exonuclease III
VAGDDFAEVCAAALNALMRAMHGNTVVIGGFSLEDAQYAARHARGADQLGLGQLLAARALTTAARHIYQVVTGSGTPPRVAVWYCNVRRGGAFPPAIGSMNPYGGEGPILVSVNVTSLSQAWSELAKRPWDIALLQEANVAGHEPVLQDIARAGVRWCPGPLGPSGVCLVGALVRCGEAGEVGEQAPRSHTLLWRPSQGPAWAITNVYGPADGSPASLLETSRYIRDAMVFQQSRGRLPGAIVGDFNAELHQLSSSYAIDLAGYKDVGEEPTSRAHNSSVYRRIDHMLFSPAARRALSSYQVS